jgi:hypothetical protein
VFFLKEIDMAHKYICGNHSPKKVKYVEILPKDLKVRCPVCKGLMKWEKETAGKPKKRSK